jgi:hypothetical protein
MRSFHTATFYGHGLAAERQFHLTHGSILFKNVDQCMRFAGARSQELSPADSVAWSKGASTVELLHRYVHVMPLIRSSSTVQNSTAAGPKFLTGSSYEYRNHRYWENGSLRHSLPSCNYASGRPLRNLRQRGLPPAGGPYNDLRLHPIDAKKAH